MSDLAALAELIVAAVELSVVRSIRKAVKANLIAAGGVEGALGTITMPHGPLQTHGALGWHDPAAPDGIAVTRSTQQKLDVARLLDERRCDLHACTPRAAFVGSDARLANQAAPVDPAAGIEPERPLRERLTPLVPPWRLPLPVDPVVTTRVVKWEAAKPDLMHKGQLVDLFL